MWSSLGICICSECERQSFHFGEAYSKYVSHGPWALGSVLFVTRNEPADPATIALHTPSTDSKLRIFMFAWLSLRNPNRIPSPRNVRASLTGLGHSTRGDEYSTRGIWRRFERSATVKRQSLLPHASTLTPICEALECAISTGYSTSNSHLVARSTFQFHSE